VWQPLRRLCAGAQRRASRKRVAASAWSTIGSG
jgi:hypothetical protein